MLLDTQTVLLLLCVGDLTLFLLLVAIGRSLRFEGDLGFFPYGRLLQGLGLAIFLLRGVFPGTLSVMLCNASFIAGLAIEAFCLTSVGQTPRPGTHRRWVAVTTVVCAIFAVIYFGGASITTRTFVYSLIAAGFALTVAITLLMASGTKLRRTVCLFLLLAAVPMLPWGLDLLGAGPSATLFADSTVTTITLLMFYVQMMISSISYLMIHREIIAIRLEQAATRDFLTGVFNRRQFLKLSAIAVTEAIAKRSPVSVLMLDLDEFKAINDTYGHAVGDQVLQQFCQRSVKAIRETDILGRYGGDEFVVFAPNTSAAEIVGMGEHLRSLTHQDPADLPAYHISVGTATIVPTSADDLERLIVMADKALLQAKEHGRDQVIDWRYA
ncbi:MAG: GGDEF domain-containing protein [Bacillota bacterium]